MPHDPQVPHMADDKDRMQPHGMLVVSLPPSLSLSVSRSKRAREVSLPPNPPLHHSCPLPHTLATHHHTQAHFSPQLTLGSRRYKARSDVRLCRSYICVQRGTKNLSPWPLASRPLLHQITTSATITFSLSTRTNPQTNFLPPFAPTRMHAIQLTLPIVHDPDRTGTLI